MIASLGNKKIFECCLRELNHNHSSSSWYILFGGLISTTSVDTGGLYEVREIVGSRGRRTGCGTVSLPPRLTASEFKIWTADSSLLTDHSSLFIRSTEPAPSGGLLCLRLDSVVLEAVADFTVSMIAFLRAAML